MPLDIYNGIIQLKGATTSYSGVGFSGKVFIFYGVDQSNTDASYSGDFRYTIGYATISGPGGLRRNHCVGGKSVDNVGTSIAASQLHTSGCIGYVNNSGQLIHSYDVQSGDGDGFTLRLGNFTSGQTAVSGFIGVTVLGGSDLTEYAITTTDSESGDGSFTYFGGGLFSSGTAIFCIAADTSGGLNQPSQHSHVTFGMATDSGFQGCVSVFSRHNSASGNTKRWIRDNRFYTSINSSGIERAIVRFNGFRESGWSLAWLSGDQHSNTGLSTLTLKISGNQKVFSWDAESGTGNQYISGVGFRGKHLMFLSHDTSNNNFTDASNENRLSIGAVTLSGNQTAIWAGDNDGPTTTQSSRLMRTDACIHAAIPASDPASASGTFIANFVGFSGDGFTINKSGNAFNSTASGMSWITMILGEIEAQQFLPGINANPRSFGSRSLRNFTFASAPTFGG